MISMVQITSYYKNIFKNMESTNLEWYRHIKKKVFNFVNKPRARQKQALD